MLLWPTLCSRCSLGESECEHALGGVRKKPLWQRLQPPTATQEAGKPTGPLLGILKPGSDGLLPRASAPQRPSLPLISAFQSMLKVRV